MITLGISKIVGTGEYRVFWREDGKDDELISTLKLKCIPTPSLQTVGKALA